LEEFRLEGAHIGNRTVIPGMTFDLFNSGPVGRFKREHGIDKISEFKTVKLFLARLFGLILFMSLPKDVLSAGDKELVMGIALGVSFGKWWGSTDHDEKNDGRSKEIDGGTAVGFSQVNFGSHVGFSTQNSVKLSSTVLTAEKSGETEIGDLQVEVGIKQEIFGLEISVNNTLAVAVFQSFNENSEIGSGDFLGESARVGNVLKEFTTRNEFHDDRDSLVGFSVFLDVISRFLEFNKVDDIGVIQGRENLDFLLQGLQVETWVGVFNDFDSKVLVGRRIITELDPV